MGFSLTRCMHAFAPANHSMRIFPANHSLQIAHCEQLCANLPCKPPLADCPLRASLCELFLLASLPRPSAKKVATTRYSSIIWPQRHPFKKGFTQAPLRDCPCKPARPCPTWSVSRPYLDPYEPQRNYASMGVQPGRHSAVGLGR